MIHDDDIYSGEDGSDDQLTPDDVMLNDELEALLEDIINDESPSSVTDNSSSSDSLEIMKGKKPHKRRERRTKSRNPVYMPNLRILRRDIRRRYAEMFLYSVNSHDGALIAKFFAEFSIPNCVFQTMQLREKVKFMPPSEAPPLTSTGPHAIIYGLTRNQRVIPDSVFRFKDCQVRVREGYSGSIVQAHLTCQGHRMYQIEPWTPAIEMASSMAMFPIDDKSFYRDGLKWTLLPSPHCVRVETMVAMQRD